MELHYLSEDALDELKINIIGNIDKYKSDEYWLDSFFDGTQWNFPSNVRIEPVDLFLPQSSTMHFDYENTKKVYTALKGLTVSQATDERLWAYLTHKPFWTYMKKRWPVEIYSKKERPEEGIKKRYFFMANRDRALFHNGISRLWWYGHVSYDQQRKDPFELTKILLSKQDIAKNLLERSFSRNPDITKTILSVLHDWEKEGKPPIRRKAFRKLMIYINQLGGVTILDLLDKTELILLIREKLEILSKD